MTKEVSHETAHPATRDGIDKLESLELGETESLLQPKGHMKPDKAVRGGGAGGKGGAGGVGGVGGVGGGMPQQTLLAGACFCLASGGMTLLNKAALSSFSFKATEALLFFQCAVAVVLVQVFKTTGYIKVEPFNWNIVKVWYPANFIFVGMIITSFWALKDLGVATVTVLKNMTNLIVVTSEYFMYGRVYNRYIWLTMTLMVISAVVSGYTDMTFSASGYFWQMINSGFTAANMLYLKVAMEKVKKYTSNGERLDEYSMVFYNNLLSLPLIFLVMWGRGELGIVWEQEDLHNPAFLIVAGLSGLVGFGISFSVLWFLSTTTPTTFSLVGSLNKIPISFIGLLLYESSYSMANLLSISIGLASGVVFVVAKQRVGG